MEAAAALTDMYDQALLGILQHVGNVEEFLRVLFGFLYRKTDFYRLLLRPGDRLGFPPGAAQAMTLQVSAGARGRRISRGWWAAAAVGREAPAAAVVAVDGPPGRVCPLRVGRGSGGGCSVRAAAEMRLGLGKWGEGLGSASAGGVRVGGSGVLAECHPCQRMGSPGGAEGGESLAGRAGGDSWSSAPAEGGCWRRGAGPASWWGWRGGTSGSLGSG